MNWCKLVDAISVLRENASIFFVPQITGDPLHSRAACTQPCNVNTHSRAHCSPGARLCEQWGHGCVNNGARLCASARLCRGSPVQITAWLQGLRTKHWFPCRSSHWHKWNQKGIIYLMFSLWWNWMRKYWMYWHFLSFLKPKMVQVVEILP